MDQFFQINEQWFKEAKAKGLSRLPDGAKIEFSRALHTRAKWYPEWWRRLFRLKKEFECQTIVASVFKKNGKDPQLVCVPLAKRVLLDYTMDVTQTAILDEAVNQWLDKYSK